VDLLDKLKEVKKSQFFRLWRCNLKKMWTLIRNQVYFTNLQNFD
jgi:hypothetical protein